MNNERYLSLLRISSSNLETDNLLVDSNDSHYKSITMANSIVHRAKHAMAIAICEGAYNNSPSYSRHDNTGYAKLDYSTLPYAPLRYST